MELSKIFAPKFPIPTRVNQLNPVYLGVGTGLNSFVANDSSSRMQMFGSHLTQLLLMKGAGVRNILSGSEKEYGKYVFNKKLNYPCRIVKILPKYPVGMGSGSVANSTTTTVLIEHESTRELDYIQLHDYHSLHQSYGYRFRKMPACRNLVENQMFPQDETILYQTPGVTDSGIYTYGRETNVAFMSLPGIIQDGVIASDEWCEQARFTAVKTAVASGGSKFVFLNLYGDDTNYKCFPDHGERVADHGVLVAMRRIDDDTALIDLSPKALRKIDYAFDKLTYAEPGAVVTDVTVWHDPASRSPKSPCGTATQMQKYHAKTMEYYANVDREYYRYFKERGDALRITPRLHGLVREAKARLLNTKSGSSKNKLTYTYRKAPLDDYRVEIQYAYEVTPTIGFKVTGCHGDKGVICGKWPKANMPRDEYGNVADMVMDGDSTSKRMNLGRVYEQYINISGRETRDRLHELLPLGKEVAFEHLIGFYEAVAPEFHAKCKEYFELQAGKGRLEEAVEHHLRCVMTPNPNNPAEGINVWIPTNCSVIGAEQIRRLMASVYRPRKSHVTYTDPYGKTIVTRNKMMIGSMYIMLLEKTGDDWSSVSSPRLQHIGLAAKLSKSDKLSTPAKRTATRIFGEDEIRLICANAGGDVAAELLDRTNNPAKHRMICRNIQRSYTPSRIHDATRGVVGRNNNAVNFTFHIQESGGIGIE